MEKLEKFCKENRIDKETIQSFIESVREYFETSLTDDSNIDKELELYKCGLWQFDDITEKIVFDYEKYEYREFMQEGIIDFITKNINVLKKETKKGIIYILKDLQSGFYKIGITTQTIKSRVKELSTGNPNLLVIATTDYTDNFFSKETQIHNELKHKRIANEWFNLNKEELEKIIKKYNFCKKAIENK